MAKTPANKPDISAENNAVRDFTFHSIGVICSSARYHYEAPRQAVFSGRGAFLRWLDPAYRACAEDLVGFDRVWLIWVFNLNKHDRWHTKVRVPVPAEHDTYSLFATRSPYRPNPIGISAVKLEAVTEQGLQLGVCDLLDGTMVLDVKPYIPEADAFPDSRAGWRDRIDRRSFDINWSEPASVQADFIAGNGQLDLKNFCAVQLSIRPTDKSRKRLDFNVDTQEWILHCRTWKIHFAIDEQLCQVSIKYISSNYSPEDLQTDAPDLYCDKDLHRKFQKIFL